VIGRPWKDEETERIYRVAEAEAVAIN
jgi:hypothetical protein